MGKQVILSEFYLHQARGCWDISVNNSGDGTAVVDRSDRIASDSVDKSSTTTDKSDHSAVSDPTIVTQPEPTIVTQPEPQAPIIIEKDVVVVEQPTLSATEE